MSDPTYCPQCGNQFSYEEQAGRPRPVCHSCGYVAYHNPVPGVGVLCEIDDGLVFVRRGHPPFEGEWVLPSGYIEADESSEQAAMRECHEETGLEIDLIELFGVDSYSGDMLGSGIVIFYRARMVGGSLQAGDDATDARVFPQDSLPEYIPFRTHRDVIARWLTAQSPPGEAVSPGVQIRPSRQADRDSIIDLLQAIPANRDINAEELQAVRHRLRQKLGYEVLVAELANAVVGYLVLSFVPALSGLRAWIDDIAVNPAFQRQGVGASLVEAAMRLADQRGATHIFVYAGRANVAAREFYRACGFDEEGVARVRIR